MSQNVSWSDVEIEIEGLRIGCVDFISKGAVGFTKGVVMRNVSGHEIKEGSLVTPQEVREATPQEVKEMEMQRDNEVLARELEVTTARLTREQTENSKLRKALENNAINGGLISDEARADRKQKYEQIDRLEALLRSNQRLHTRRLDKKTQRVLEFEKKCDALTDRVNELTHENNALECRIEDLQESLNRANEALKRARARKRRA